jgi:RNase P/RNase MRP subunit p29
MPDTYLLTRRQLVCLESLPHGHKVVSTRYGVLVVRRPDGHLVQVQPNGRLVPINPVERVQSYLQLSG